MALSGGANNGAWEAGVLKGLMEYGNEEDFYYDIVTGVSAGAINTAALAAFAPDDIKNATSFLSDTWTQISNPDVWKLWEDEGLVKGCLTETGCFDDSPLVAFTDRVLKEFPDGFKKHVAVGSANVSNGWFEVFTNKNTRWEDFHEAAVASSSIPGVFPAAHFKHKTLMDGGTIWDVDVISAIAECAFNFDV